MSRLKNWINKKLTNPSAEKASEEQQPLPAEPKPSHEELAALERERHIVTHPLVHGMPKISMVSQPAVDRPDRSEIAHRLMKAYLRAKADEHGSGFPVPNNDLWTNLLNAEFKDLMSILASGDASALSNFLLHFGENYTWFGGLSLGIDGFNHQKEPDFVALSYFDKLVCLAESVGVLSVENPEQGDLWGRNLYIEPDKIADEIEAATGVRLVPPPGAVPVTGIATKHGPLHYRHFNSFYVALRIKAVVPENGAVCEYGGGLGMVAYYANKLGFKNYTIFDLPLVNLFAGHYLMNTLGAESVRLYGEENSTASVSIMPYWRCISAEAGSYSLALNQDSFPEIDPDLVLEYLRQIGRTTSKYFLSINQEAQATMGSRSQNSVPTLVRSCKVFNQLYRMKYWIREGYVEELYEIRP